MLCYNIPVVNKLNTENHNLSCTQAMTAKAPFQLGLSCVSRQQQAVISEYLSAAPEVMPHSSGYYIDRV